MSHPFNTDNQQQDLRRANIAYLGAMLEEYEGLLPYMTWQEQAELDALLSGIHTPIWEPFPGPQIDALDCLADELFYGGAAGGGKTDLLLGCGLTRHWRSIVFRREYAELKGIRERAEELYENIGKFNGQLEIWRITKGEFTGKRIEFGACQFEGDERKFQGRPHDLKGFDELTQFTEAQYRFLTTWNRTTRPGQRCRIIATGNPPVNEQGQWVIQYWGPWLDPAHPNPAKEGELRWFVTDGEGKDKEVPDANPVEIIYPDGTADQVYPKSRTFIRALVENNPRLMESGYRRTLQNLPEPLRSRMLRGDFNVGREDAEWQVIPTDWIIQAQARWAPTFEQYVLKLERQKLKAAIKEALDRAEAISLATKATIESEAIASSEPVVPPSPTPGAVQRLPANSAALQPGLKDFKFGKDGVGIDLSAFIGEKLSDDDIRLNLLLPTKEKLLERKINAFETGAVGVDVARGGRDDTITVERLEGWFSQLKTVPGKQTRDGGTVIKMLIDMGYATRKIHIDVTGVGTSPVDIGKMQGMDILPMVGSEKSHRRDRSGKLGFHNTRSDWWWGMREALDPNFGSEIALPPDPQLIADLTAPRWSLSSRGIQVEDKQKIKDRLGRSPDKGDAVVYAHAEPFLMAEAYLRYMKELSEQSKKAGLPQNGHSEEAKVGADSEV